MQTERTIYLDYQASTPVDPAVLQEMLPFFNESFANPHAANHAAGWTADAAVRKAQDRLAKLIGCDADEIIFTSGATESNNLAILGLRRTVTAAERNKIITTSIEHKSVLEPCRVMKGECNSEILICKVDKFGGLDLDHLRRLLSDQVMLLTIGSVNGEIGTIQNFKEIYSLASRFGVLVHLDGAQMPLARDMSDACRYADMISLSGHKMYGPKGIGCLFIRRDLQRQIVPLVFGGEQQNGLRSGTLPVPLCVGMGAAADLLGRVPDERASVRSLTRKLWQELRKLGHEIVLNGAPIDERHPGNMNVRFPGFEAEEILSALQPDLAISTGSACTSGTMEPSHVLRGIGLTEDQARSALRFSLGRLTTEDEIARAVELVDKTLERLEFAGVKQIA